MILKLFMCLIIFALLPIILGLGLLKFDKKREKKYIFSITFRIYS